MLTRMRSLVLALLVLAPPAAASLAPARAAAQAQSEQDRIAQAKAELATAQGFLEQGDFESAEPHLVAFLSLDPGNAPVWNLLGSARFALKRWKSACEAFERAATLLPREAEVANNLGAARFELQQLEAAASSFRRVLELSPGNSRAHLFLARIAVLGGDEALAEREFAQAVAAREPDPLAPFHQGIFLLQSRRLDEAHKAFEQAIALDPNLPGAWLNLGLVLQRKGETEKARAALEHFRQLSELLVGEERQRLRVTALLKAASSDLENGRLDAALVSALQARDLAPDTAVVHRFLAHIYALQGRKGQSKLEEDRAQAIESGALRK